MGSMHRCPMPNCRKHQQFLHINEKKRWCSFLYSTCNPSFLIQLKLVRKTGKYASNIYNQRTASPGNSLVFDVTTVVVCGGQGKILARPILNFNLILMINLTQLYAAPTVLFKNYPGTDLQ